MLRTLSLALLALLLASCAPMPCSARCVSQPWPPAR